MLTKILHISLWVISLISLFVLLGASVSSSNQVVLHEVNVGLKYGEDNFFIHEKEVMEVVSDFGYMADSTLMRTINPGRIEELLENNAFVGDAEVYKELNGQLHVDVKVRQPVLRIYNNLGQSVYLDETGVFMPTSRKYAARSTVVNGAIRVDFNPLLGKNIHELAEMEEGHPDFKMLKDAFDISEVCRASKLWKAQFTQIFIRDNGDIELIPRVGDHVINVGSAMDIEKKLNKLKLFYSEGLDKTGWNEYKIINLKYANQVVCSKS